MVPGASSPSFCQRQSRHYYSTDQSEGEESDIEVEAGEETEAEVEVQAEAEVEAEVEAIVVDVPIRRRGIRERTRRE
jgi:hypothetical protein